MGRASSRSVVRWIGCLALLLAASAAGGEEAGEPVLIGTVSREEIEAALPRWVEAAVEAEVDADAARALAAVPDGARVTVLLGTWCPDSRREVSRLWRALDETGSMVPFEVEYVGVDRDKRDPAGRAAAAGLLYVPTFVVERDGREVGRIVEESPASVEEDLLALLTGEASGVLTGSRPELLAEDAQEPEG